MSSFLEYNMNYGNDSILVNATLEWLDSEKREYILFRNNVMYDKGHKCIKEE